MSRSEESGEAAADLGIVDSEPVASPTVISYVRGPYDAQVADLAARLIRDGVPCDLDLFETRPRGGWSRWMTEKMTGTDVVLVVCSEPYYKRYHLEEQPGVGKGATFEGGMLSRRVLDAQGSEHGVIPIVFERDDLRFIPEFLRDETYFVLPEQFDDLYRVLTRQPAFVKPPLGKIRTMPPVNAAERAPSEPPTPSPTRPAPTSVATLPLAAFGFDDGSFVFGRYAELGREGSVITIALVVEDDVDAANFPRLQAKSGTIEMVWALDGATVRAVGYREVHRDGKQVVELRFNEQPRRGSSFMSEGSINGISADQIALRRARRILLNERPAEESELGSFSTQRLNERVLEQYVSGSMGGSDFAVKGSPIPLYVPPENPTSESIEAARLMCAFMLLRTNTVERISRLDLRLVSGGVAVEFNGIRARQASNVEPSALTVSGTCPLP